MVRVAREEEERLKREVKNEKVWIWQLVYHALLFCGYPDKKLSEMLMIYAGLE